MSDDASTTCSDHDASNVLAQHPFCCLVEGTRRKWQSLAFRLSRSTHHVVIPDRTSFLPSLDFQRVLSA